MKLLNLACRSHYHKDWINLDFKSNSEYVIEYDLEQLMRNYLYFLEKAKKRDIKAQEKYEWTMELLTKW